MRNGVRSGVENGFVLLSVSRLVCAIKSRKWVRFANSSVAGRNGLCKTGRPAHPRNTTTGGSTLKFGGSARIGTARAAAGGVEPTFSAQIEVVNVLATVRDKKSQLVNTLTQDDFAVSENGRP